MEATIFIEMDHPWILSPPIKLVIALLLSYRSPTLVLTWPSHIIMSLPSSNISQLPPVNFTLLPRGASTATVTTAAIEQKQKRLEINGELDDL